MIEQHGFVENRFYMLSEAFLTPYLIFTCLNKKIDKDEFVLPDMTLPHLYKY